MQLESLNPQEYRLKLAGLFDPGRKPDRLDDTSVRLSAIDFVIVLCEVFSSDLDRKTLWNRIGTALETGIAKCGGSVMSFVHYALEHVKADKTLVAVHPKLSQMVQTWEHQPPEWSKNFLAYIRHNIYTLLIHSRSEWQAKKEAKHV